MKIQLLFGQISFKKIVIQSTTVHEFMRLPFCTDTGFLKVKLTVSVQWIFLCRESFQINGTLLTKWLYFTLTCEDIMNVMFPSREVFVFK